ncbi:hypothetical protein COT97_05185 [Candidatus Falkowbacteria bacterium CG10_big_fil_rev_8_21_14_0_10_39_11]|uniref:Uncharacterized protein n=1 Tax=Candidatus Falkowbacteria bacterium CG10_big_fil_rev_8_21_14_0_10_39_11 TaxID=1974565 RepID=A0A2H0V3P1_9BACT|nr:MAG: hypothetical protein COT97_05185 [Candidatus Falkowbacteria bacterium CG10_big_fil_rev_8_21_14_0_10_39_11]
MSEQGSSVLREHECTYFRSFSDWMSAGRYVSTLGIPRECFIIRDYGVKITATVVDDLGITNVTAWTKVPGQFSVWLNESAMLQDYVSGVGDSMIAFDDLNIPRDTHWH